MVTLASMSRNSACSTGGANRLLSCPPAAVLAANSVPGRGCRAAYRSCMFTFYFLRISQTDTALSPTMKFPDCDVKARPGVRCLDSVARESLVTVHSCL